jgi:hypothetical protein
MHVQIQAVRERDGVKAAIQYAKQTLAVYRQCARPKPDGSKHFAHLPTFRHSYVEAMLYLRRFMREGFPSF